MRIAEATKTTNTNNSKAPTRNKKKKNEIITRVKKKKKKELFNSFSKMYVSVSACMCVNTLFDPW